MRVIVAEDGVLRDALVHSLPHYGVEVVGQARTTEELLQLVDADPPDIVTLDLEMPRHPEGKPEIDAGLEAAKDIRARHPTVSLLILSQHAGLPWAEEVVSLGSAVGYLLKDRVQQMDTLLEAMRAVCAGDVRIDKTLIAAVFARKRLNDRVDDLTPRERRVLQLIAEGLSNAAIAEELFIEEKTVESHETLIYRKLGLSELSARSVGRPKVNVRVMAVLAFLRSSKSRLG